MILCAIVLLAITAAVFLAIDFGSSSIVTSGGGFFGSITISGGSGFVGNSQVIAGAGIEASKLDHKYIATYAQPNTTATTERKAIHAAHKAGTIAQFRAATTVACIGAATITLLLRKNGTNILSGVFVLDSGNTAMIFENGPGFTSSSVAAGDYFEVDATAAAGGGTLGTGLTVQLILDEDY